MAGPRAPAGDGVRGAAGAAGPAGRDHATDIVLRHGLFDALRTLAPRQRAVVVLGYYEDRSEAEVAELLDVSVGTVRSTASRALAKLRATYPLADIPFAEEATP